MENGGVTGKVVALHVSLAPRQPMANVQTAEAVANLGLKGDRHAQEGSLRQVLVMDAETLDSLGLSPGDIKENITIQGIDLPSLQAGQQMVLGAEATLEVTIPCEACDRLDELRTGLQQELQGRRGMLARVVRGGVIQVGDIVKAD